jgi:putative copper resistance protein D
MSEPLQLEPVLPGCLTSRMTTIAWVLTLAFVLLYSYSPSWAQEHHAHHEHPGMSLPANGPTPKELLSWKRESEGNHHLVGLAIVLSGLFILTQGMVTKRLTAVRYVWPSCFLLSGVFVLIYSDTELWPFGPKAWINGTLTNPEVIQHKVFSLLLLGVGLIELQRARERLNRVWAAWVFPLLAVAGSVLLLFHSHDAGMRGENHMAIHARIQAEHLSYAVTGFCIGLAKGLAGVSSRWQRFFSRLWPTLMVVLGILLLCYVE